MVLADRRRRHARLLAVKGSAGTRRRNPSSLGPERAQAPRARRSSSSASPGLRTGVVPATATRSTSRRHGSRSGRAEECKKLHRRMQELHPNLNGNLLTTTLLTPTCLRVRVKALHLSITRSLRSVSGAAALCPPISPSSSTAPAANAHSPQRRTARWCPHDRPAAGTPDRLDPRRGSGFARHLSEHLPRPRPAAPADGPHGARPNDPRCRAGALDH